MGGNFHPKLNIGGKPIANKYREGKMKRTLKRELKVPEIAEREANKTLNIYSLTDLRGSICYINILYYIIFMVNFENQ